MQINCYEENSDFSMNNLLHEHDIELEIKNKELNAKVMELKYEIEFLIDEWAC